MQRTATVTLTGRIAAGKSEALAGFGARYGDPSSDTFVHTLLSEDDDVRPRSASAEAKTQSAIAADQRDRVRGSGRAGIARAAAAPRTRALGETWLQSVDGPLAVIEIPLLFETGGEERFDEVVVITAPRELVRSARPFADREAPLIPRKRR